MSVDALEALTDEERPSLLLPTDALVAHWPAVYLADDDAGKFLAGMRRLTDLDDAPSVRVYGPEPAAFLGIAHVAGGELIATRLLSPAEVGRIAAPGRPLVFSGAASAPASASVLEHAGLTS